MLTLKSLTLVTLLAPLTGALIAGVANKRLSVKTTQLTTILLIGVSLLAALRLAWLVLVQQQHLNTTWYTWGQSGQLNFTLGFLLDPLTVIMLLVVTSVSLLVHIYSIGYMADDSSNPRFFSYMSLFTFAMLLLVTANNFLQLFIGWEGVGLASYLLIGFWFERKSATTGSLKAFLVNRVGDLGLLLGIAALLDYTGTLDYQAIFSQASLLSVQSMHLFGTHASVVTVICLLLFIGAMGKSAQIPLHVWLPESMAGPTPISALIHAATMVTAGIFLVARLSPLFELSVTALSTVLIVGATGALLLGLLAFVENDIKRVIAYSTMSQLGYMMAANGASAYSAGLFHLVTHAGFKALLFLSAGSVIIAMHHEQDLRRMGNLKKYLPVTYICFLVGALSLAAIPPFSGFYSKDTIIEVVKQANIPGAHYAYYCLLIGAFVTSYYIFRAFFMAFHGSEKYTVTYQNPVREPGWSMRLPLIVLTIASIIIGALLANAFLTNNLLGKSVIILTKYDAMKRIVPPAGLLHGFISAFTHPAFWLSLAGFILAWLTTLGYPQLTEYMQKRFSIVRNILLAQYGFDGFNNLVFVKGVRYLSTFFYKTIDLTLIDNGLVDGSGRGINRLAHYLRRLQSGYLYNYILVMILAVVIGLFFLVIRYR